MPSIDNKKIKKNCPRCGCEKKAIELCNCGPMVYVQCPRCRFRLTEGVDSASGIDNMFATWNNEMEALSKQITRTAIEKICFWKSMKSLN